MKRNIISVSYTHLYQQVIYNRNKWLTKEMDAFIRITANHSGTGSICGGNDI